MYLNKKEKYLNDLILILFSASHIGKLQMLQAVLSMWWPLAKLFNYKLFK